MKLSKLLKEIDDYVINNKEDDPDIKNIFYNSNNVTDESIFVAITGSKSDGHKYIEHAIQKGAKVIIAENEIKLPDNIINIRVKNSRKALALIAKRFYNNPSDKLFLIGITGTNGKTTTAYLIESILQNAGFKTGLIGTIEYKYNDQNFPNPLTTPESLDLHKIFAEMVNAGVNHVIMEVSSHALDLYRVYGCHYDICIFTNLTQDHLDYHKTLDHYKKCKKKLFFEPYLSKKNAAAIINNDDSLGTELSKEILTPLITTGMTYKINVYTNYYETKLDGTMLRIEYQKQIFDIQSNLYGKHNILNILSAISVGIVKNIPFEIIVKAISKKGIIPGRLEKIANNKSRYIFVDYAHTPDALENVLLALKDKSEQRLICVFGCGGDRDTGKRPLMGNIAAKIADLLVVTSDNPRTEDPILIIKQIISGIEKENLFKYNNLNINDFDKKVYIVEPDRKEAIKLAISLSKPKDIVLIAGKGHENYQIFKNKTIHFDDKKEALNALNNIN